MTTPDSAEAVNVRIAELCGWKDIRISTPWEVTDPPEDREVYCGQEPVKFGNGWARHTIPNYSTSLDAMHEAEKTLRVDELETYMRALVPNEQQWINYPMNAYWLMTHANAAQRAAAFLTTKMRTNR